MASATASQQYNSLTTLPDRIPRRRKRHYNNKSLMLLLIFVGCCLTLILSPLHVQAKETNNATSKGENMLSNDHQSHQHEKDATATNIKSDKTNDNGTFKRLQETSDNKIANEEHLQEATEDEYEDEHSSEVIEMIQPPHTLRHQEHYKQRILLAEKHRPYINGKANTKADTDADDSNDNDDDDDNDYNMEGEEIVAKEPEQIQARELTQYNRNLRYKQIQQALREPMAFPLPQHHRRHEHHLVKQQTELTWPQQQHHLRHQHNQHQHHQHQQQIQNLESHHQPQLRHLKHELRKQNLTATKLKPLTQTHPRYFDRESSYYVNPFATMLTTEGPPPHLRHWKSITYTNNSPHQHLFINEGGHNNQKEADIKRFSLSLQGHENVQELENFNKAETIETLDAEANYNNSATNNNDKNEKNAADDDDDYSYEDDVDEDDGQQINKQNNYPSISSGKAKNNVKRYTNPQKQLHNRPSAVTSNHLFHKQTAGHRVRHKPAAPNMNFIVKTNSKHVNDNENNEGDDDDDDNDDYDDIKNNEDNKENPFFSASSSAESLHDADDDEGDDKLSDEKWNKIEHEHYRKQMQHQRAMQALRSRRPQNDNNPTIIPANTSKYSMHTAPASISSISTTNNAWTKRQTLNDGENDNIYSRYYVPGSVTRKKEEELGSPAAILESRRQFALQQRQNKALASAHHRRIVTEGSCRLPQPRVERIRRDSWKIYTPHCTILHRCADDAGCCPSERQTCAPKRTKNVDLYFFVISLNETQGSIEKLTFVNHTECHCIDRSRQRAPEYGSAAANNNQIPYLRRATILNCYCPNLFEKILQEDGFCRCDCSSGNMGCDWLKRGMEHFSMNDRKCIIEGRCKLPTCEYGQYIKKHGRCPRREERHLSADIDW